MTPLELSVAHTVDCTEAEGPGRRFALWLQGCPLRCPGCCNPEMLSFRGGTMVALDAMEERIRVAIEKQGIEGVTLLGGEPFAHAEVASELAERVQRLGLTVMAFTGFQIEALRAETDASVHRLLRHVDLLVDGPYQQELPDHSRRWIGSTNQGIHFLTDRYDATDRCWEEPNTLEIRLEGGEVRVNGFPAQQAVSVWKRPRAK
ncbi:MAG: 4Fe-4S single cluster domain-containing protein [Rubripirellula sp.]